MKPVSRFPHVDRRVLVLAVAMLPVLSTSLASVSASAQTSTSSDALPSWNDGASKKAVLDFVRDITDRASPKFVPPEERIATFDQDGTLWVEHSVYVR